MKEEQDRIQGPHQGQPVLSAGKGLDQATAAMIMIHGRGATAQSILTLATEVPHPDMAYLAPQAAGNSWYPLSFLAPIVRNEPGLSSGLLALRGLFDRLSAVGIPPERVILLGFSQGACLALEFAARHARRYGGVIGLSGGLIGPESAPRDYAGALEGTPIFLGCSDVDFHVPKERVQHSAEVLERLGGLVTMRLYPNMGHTINQDELAFVREMLTRIGTANRRPLAVPPQRAASGA
jgi:predicted esterase